MAVALRELPLGLPARRGLPRIRSKQSGWGDLNSRPPAPNRERPSSGMRNSANEPGSIATSAETRRMLLVLVATCWATRGRRSSEFVAEFANALSQLRTWDGGDLVDHEAAGLPKSVGVIRLDPEPEQWRFGRIGGEGAHRHGACCVEVIVLHDRHRPRLADVTGAGRSGPNLASPQASSRLIASMNAWSSASCLLAATAVE